VARKSALNANKRKKLEALFQKHGYEDFKWIDPEKIVVSQWVRMKCMFGCPHYGQKACCPPNMPTVSECERFFREYTDGVIFHIEGKVKKVEDLQTWSKKGNLKLSKLEREVFLSGYERAFLLSVATCRICTQCSFEKENCKEPKISRPTPEAMAVDVYTTARLFDYPIKPVTDYSQKMNRYAFLMVT
jgi:predicted metal-binding protein